MNREDINRMAQEAGFPYRDEWLKVLGRYEFMGEGADFLADFIRARGQS